MVNTYYLIIALALNTVLWKWNFKLLDLINILTLYLFTTKLIFQSDKFIVRQYDTWEVHRVKRATDCRSTALIILGWIGIEK